MVLSNRLLWSCAALSAVLNAQQYAISSVAGGGPRVGMTATAVFLESPQGVVWDSAGRFYVTNGSQVIRVNQSGVIDQVIGSSAFGYSGNGSLATSPAVQMDRPTGLAIDRSGNLYISDTGNNVVRKVDAVTGIITTVAGGACCFYLGDGVAATSTSLSAPMGVALDSSGNLFIADSGNDRIRKVDAVTGIISTVVGTGVAGASGDGGLATAAQIWDPQSVAVAPNGDLYLAYFGSASSADGPVRKVSAATGIITTVVPANFLHNQPTSVVLDPSGNVLVADRSIIEKVTSATGAVTTFAGSGDLTPFAGEGGPASAATFYGFGTMAIDPLGNILYADPYDARVFRIDGATGILTTVAGNGNAPQISYRFGTFLTGDGGPAALAWLSQPTGLALDASNDLFIGDPWNDGRLRKITASTGIITTVAGNGTTNYSGDGGPAASAGLGAVFVMPVAVDSSNNVYLGEDTVGRIRRIDAKTGIITTIAGGGGVTGIYVNGQPATDVSLGGVKDLLIKGTTLYLTDGSLVYKIDLATNLISLAANLAATSIDLDAAGNIYFTNGDLLGKWTSATGTVSTLAGTHQNCSYACDLQIGGYTGAQLGDGGPANTAILNAPQGVRLDSAGNIYIADTGDHRVRFISAATGIISTIAGTNLVGCDADSGPATGALLSGPTTLVRDAAGHMYFTDVWCGQVYKLTPYTGSVEAANCTTVSGWAADQTRPNQSINVSIYDGSTLLATISANQSRPDIAAQLGDNGLHGFSYSVPASFKGSSHTIHVFYETSGVELAGSSKAFTCTPNYTGNVDSSSCSGIIGWAADRNQPNTPITVSLWDGTTQIASTTANIARTDIGSFLGDNGLHGFSLAIPAAYANNVAHTLQIHYESTGTSLPGSPAKLICTSFGGGGTGANGLVFYPVTPCRVADTRVPAGFSGQFGPPSMPGGTTRTFNVLASSCAAQIPSNAAAYAMNFTVVPPAGGPSANLTTWPTGASSMPNVSTLNYSNSVVANAAIVAAGTNGAINVFVNYPTDVLFDITGYFAPPTSSGLEFYTVTPCRIADTRVPAGFTGQFGPPSMAGGATRAFNLPASGCGIPTTASAYSLNFTAVPPSGGPPANLTTWPATQPTMPNVSTLNYSSSVVANAAIVPAGTNEAIDVFVNYPTDVLFDINGYFAPPQANGLHFYPVTPCRIADTRPPAGFVGQFGPPSMPGGATRTFNIPLSGCGIPSSAVAYSLNFTVVPPAGGPPANLTTWPTGAASMPNVSTLNYYGSVVANAAIVPAGTNGSINVFANFATDVLFDINGYFAP